MKIYLIHPVRETDEQTRTEVADYVAKLEKEGHCVYFPQRDAPQDDPTGFNICGTHARAMEAADYIDVIWDVNSKGSHFDLGMAWALRKRLGLIRLLQPDSQGKSYAKVMHQWKNWV